MSKTTKQDFLNLVGGILLGFAIEHIIPTSENEVLPALILGTIGIFLFLIAQKKKPTQ